ncbi:MAG: 50S ribosomal protein L30 [Alphaproteobacteria bacterium MarineAlpha3_Bin7]|nr:MAG: 50S ribosomal protein L30 [Alphaproteobacteria bacterium MarineAlpha3_Bin7]
MSEEKKYIIISQVRSGIGRDRSQKKTLIGLGLGKLNKMRKIEDTPAVRGMINKVKHLVDVEN